MSTLEVDKTLSHRQLVSTIKRQIMEQEGRAEAVAIRERLRKRQAEKQILRASASK